MFWGFLLAFSIDVSKFALAESIMEMTRGKVTILGGKINWIVLNGYESGIALAINEVVTFQSATNG